MSDGRKKKYIEMFGSFTDPFNCPYLLMVKIPFKIIPVSASGSPPKSNSLLPVTHPLHPPKISLQFVLSYPVEKRRPKRRLATVAKVVNRGGIGEKKTPYLQHPVYYVVFLILYARYPVALRTLHLQLHAFCYCFFFVLFHIFHVHVIILL